MHTLKMAAFFGAHIENSKANKGVQGTLHKVSGPLTPDVGIKTI